jgi:hypothetical protein
MKATFQFLILISIVNITACQKKHSVVDASIMLIQWNDLVISTMKTDGINPVLATRIFLYPNVAVCEIMSKADTVCPQLSGVLNELSIIENPKVDINYELAAVHAYYKTLLTLIYREDVCTTLYIKQIKLFQDRLDKNTFENSIAYGEIVAQAVIKWSATDRYNKTKGRPYYHAKKIPGAWIPTPPEFRPALEPHWGTLRPAILDSFSSYSAPPAVAFSLNTTSAFYALAFEVYNSSLHITNEQRSIALFWDDNPDLNNFNGHLPTPRRHINPTAHWMSIVGQVLRREKNDFDYTAKIYASVAVAFFDANLVCWHDKFTYNLIRPVTYIQDNIDSKWMPLLVTPPFPEYTSGHSACSAACATVLTQILGDNYAFTDSTHFESGLGVRKFDSFNTAAREAGISRFYGGIHYITTLEQSGEQGRLVGFKIIDKLSL